MILRTIYGLVDPRTECVRYVGQTKVNPSDRYRSHINQAGKPATSTRPKTPKDSWILKLLGMGLKPQLVILSQGYWTQAEVDEQEISWIYAYRLVHPSMNLNVSEGGNPGVEGYVDWVAVWSPERRQAHSEKMKKWAADRRAVGIDVSPSEATRKGKQLMWADPERSARVREKFSEIQKKTYAEYSPEELTQRLSKIKSEDYSRSQSAKLKTLYEGNVELRSKISEAVKASITDESRAKMSAAHRKHGYLPKPCEFCGETFSIDPKTYKPGKKTCSEKCRQDLRVLKSAETRARKKGNNE